MSQHIRAVSLNGELPSTVKAVRDGWTTTASSAAIVSGLLASAAAQLLSTFKGDTILMNREPRDRNLVLVLCYAALFLNIGATVSTFILTDNLSQIDYNTAAGRADPTISHMLGNQSTILKQFGASPSWSFMVFHCFTMFYLGFLSLFISVLSYVWLAETKPVAIAMSVIISFILVPTFYLVIIRPFVDIVRRDKSSGNQGYTDLAL